MTGFLRKENLNGPNEISCTAYKYVDGERSPLWDKITDFKVIYIPEYQEKYEIHISGAEENETTKSITGTALAEAELSQLLLEHLEINTENDMARTSTVPGAGYDENFPTLFYRDPDKIHDYGAVWNSSDKYQNYSPEDKREVLRTSSLLHRLLEKAPNYHIGHIDDTLQSLNLVLSFGISNTYLYDELVGEISEEYGVLFIFDSIAKTVSAYDLMNTCDGCGYRGDFENVCPKCGSVSCHGQYGEDTAIFVSGKNLAESITKDSDPDSVKTCFRIEGGDDIITAAISNINPNGTNRIFSIPPELMNDMPIDLAEKINSYNKICDEYDSTYPFHLHLDDYNDCVGYLKDYYPDAEYPTFSSLLIGYSQTTNLLYNLIDMESVLKTSMMPTAKYDNPSITETMKIISNMKDIAVRYPAASTTTYVNNAVLDMVKASINTALYKAEIYENNGYPQYTQNTTGTWRGYIKLTSLEVEEGEIAESQTSDLLTFPITDNVELYIKQKIQKNMAKVEINDIMDLTNVGDNSMTIEDFRNRLHYYSADYLDNLKTEFEACLSIMYEMQGVADSQTYSRFIDVYNKRINAIVTEKNRRDGQLEKLYRLYYLNQTDFTESGELIDARNNVKNALNFEKYLGDLWPVFCSYLREDTYQNSNYISMGLNNQGIIERARELWDTAKRELEKSSHNQYTINTTLDNLLQIPEFDPLTENFRTGNWIHVAFDDEVYRLRLLSYQINFDELQTIDVEFSTAVNYGGSFSDVKNVIDSARTISGSYNAVANQVQKTSDAAKYVHGWVKDGLNATMTKYVNDPFTQDIVIDKNGILCRAYDELKEEYDLCQIRILRNGMYLTNDGWENVYAGIGKISYYDPIAKKQKDDYGIIAKTVVGRLVLGEFLGFTNSNGTLSFDTSGLKVEGNNTAVYINPNSANVFSIKKKSSSSSGYNTNVMYVDANGNGYFKGEISSVKGSIGGWEIGDGYMRNKDTNNKYVGVGVNGVTYAFYAGGTASNGEDAPFRVSHDGTLRASKAIISGSIQATEFSFKKMTGTSSYVSIGTGTGTLSTVAFDGTNYAQVVVHSEAGDGANLDLLGDKGIWMYGGDIQIDSAGNIDLAAANIINIKASLDGGVHVKGEVDIEEGNVYVNNDIYVSGWIRSTGSNGIYWQAYGGGWHMNDANWIKAWNNKGIYTTGTVYAGQVNVATSAATAYLNLGNNGASVYTVSGDGNIYFRYRTVASAAYSYVNVRDIITTLNGKAASSHTHSYLPLSGGTVTGSLTVNGYVKSQDTYDRLYSGTPNMYITSNAIYSRTSKSSRRYKQDIHPLSGSLRAEKLLSIPVIQYVYKSGYLAEDDQRYKKPMPGFIAEDVAKYYPIAAELDADGRPDDWNIRMIVPPMLTLIQDAYKKTSDNSSRISMLQSQIDRQETEIQTLKAKLQYETSILK